MDILADHGSLEKGSSHTCERSEQQEHITAHADKSSTGSTLPSNIMPNAMQIDDGDRVRFLDCSFRDLFVTGNGRPVWCKRSDLTRFASKLTPVVIAYVWSKIQPHE